MDVEHSHTEVGGDAHTEPADTAGLGAISPENIMARLDRPSVLVGMMGVGKSSLGRRLAAALGVEFLDADDEIETAARASIPEIFATHGEAYFRDGERRVIARLLGESDSAKHEAAPLPGALPPLPGALPPVPAPNERVRVIATGGGAFCNASTRALILARAIAVWLDADLDTLVERTSRKANRPLLQTGNPRDILERLRTTRAPLYAEAPIHLISANVPHAKTIARLLTAIDGWMRAQATPESPAPESPTP